MRVVSPKIIRNTVFLCIIVCVFVLFINYIEFEAMHPVTIEISADSDKKDREIMILLWNKFFNGYNYMLEMNRSTSARCPAVNCITTSDRKLRPVEEYDAIVFHAWQFYRNDVPRVRNPSQFYTYLSMESPETLKIDSSFNNFFNWTASYRTDSDFYWPFYTLKNTDGEVVSPGTHPNWDKYYLNSDKSSKSLVPTFKKKKKMAAWFVSNCHAHNSRDQYVKTLQKYIEVDIYGKCGSLKCPLKNKDDCLEMVRNDYFFFIAFENSHCMDYMTEKAYNGLRFDTIPVTFGRANYTNFIPPRSYLDANVLNPREMASVMRRLANNSDEYAEYFWWKGQFSFHHGSEPSLHPFCEMCKVLRKPNLKPKTYNNFVRWWETIPNSSEPACIRPIL